MTTCLKCAHVNKQTARFCQKCGSPLAPAQPSSGARSMTGLFPEATMLDKRYVIVRKLGSGGMASVYLAHDLHLSGRVCAVKEMADTAATAAERAEAVAGFEQEARVLSNLNHPNIVRVFDFFQQDGRHFLVMEYVEGSTLDDLFGQRGSAFSEREVLPWLQQLCDALNCLHSQNPPIIFRDLKPSNIMVDRNGAIKLIDFGIARRFDPAKQHDTTHLGTAGYAPPEQYGGKGQTDARSDIYALGVTVHQMLTGHNPSVTLFSLPPVRTLNGAVSKNLGDLVDRCVQADVAKRPQQVVEVQRVVTGILGTGSIPTPVSGGVSPGVAPPKRPTTRLMQAAAQLTNRQLVYLLGGTLAASVIAVLLLGPWMREHFLGVWLGLPAYFLAGPAAYAATRRMGVALAVQSLFTLMIMVTAWATTGSWLHGAGAVTAFLLGVVLSGLALEGGFYLFERPWAWKGKPDAWKWEAAWYGLTTVAAAVCFFVPWWEYNHAPSLWYWPGAFIIGVFGWFLGDLVREGKLQRLGALKLP